MATPLLAIGPMRIALLAFAAFLIACAPFADGDVSYSGWPFVTTVLAPVFAPIMLFVLPLDMTMSKLLMSDQEEAGKARYRLAIRLEAVAFALLILSWLPYLYGLWNASQIN